MGESCRCTDRERRRERAQRRRPAGQRERDAAGGELRGGRGFEPARVRGDDPENLPEQDAGEERDREGPPRDRSRPGV